MGCGYDRISWFAITNILVWPRYLVVVLDLFQLLHWFAIIVSKLHKLLLGLGELLFVKAISVCLVEGWSWLFRSVGFLFGHLSFKSMHSGECSVVRGGNWYKWCCCSECSMLNEHFCWLTSYEGNERTHAEERERVENRIKRMKRLRTSRRTNRINRTRRKCKTMRNIFPDLPFQLAQRLSEVFPLCVA